MWRATTKGWCATITRRSGERQEAGHRWRDPAIEVATSLQRAGSDFRGHAGPAVLTKCRDGHEHGAPATDARPKE